uniref:t-SNARE coiled-coil homology domain-containing protein n=1 Tax=Globisporangium ultimum (strain ATCC 200006 / CBS 805.95 / DAOM BR144) TaxID=431595 RepID=K3WTN0_GLOUD
MSRELDGLLNKLTKINNEMGGEEGRKKKGKDGGDRFHDLKTQVAERLHRLKFNLQDPEQQSAKRNKHPREAIRRQQEIREDIRLVGQDIEELKTSYEQEMKKKKSKFPPAELQIRKEVVEQYSSEFAFIKELATAGYRAPGASRSSFDRTGVASTVGNFEGSAFFTGGRGHGGRGGGYGGGGGGGGSGEGGDGPSQEEVTNEQREVMVQIKHNDQRFDMMIEQIGSGVQELGQLARGLNEELQQQSIMIDGLEERIDTTQAHVESVNMKMKKTLEKVGRSADKCMMDMICLILLLGILTVVYNMFVKKKS